MKTFGAMPPAYKPGDEESAVTQFVRALGQARNKTYELVDRPDQSNRSERAADFLFKDVETGQSLAIEHTQFIRPSEMEASNILTRGRRPRLPNSARLMRDGIESMRIDEPASIVPMSHSVKLNNEQWEYVKQVILAKVVKGQLQSTNGDERILLIEDSSLSLPDPYMDDVELSFTDSERDGIDACFIILDQSTIRQVWPNERSEF